MHDPRLLKLADVIVQHCTSVQPGDLVRISGSPLTEPLISILYKKVLEAGGHPMVSMAPENCAELLLAHGTDDQIRFENPVAQFETETIDVYASYADPLLGAPITKMTEVHKNPQTMHNANIVEHFKAW